MSSAMGEIVEKASRHQEKAEGDRCGYERKPVQEKNSLNNMEIFTGEMFVPPFKPC